MHWFWSLWVADAVLLAALLHVCLRGASVARWRSRYLLGWVRSLLGLLLVLFGGLLLRALGHPELALALLAVPWLLGLGLLLAPRRAFAARRLP